MSLKTDYKDDILAVGNLRKYQMIQNNDGTVSFQDVTQYEQTGDVFGAGDINRTNQAVNEKFDSGDVVDPMLTTEPGFAADAYQTKLQFDEQNKNLGGLRFGVDGDGNYGYYGADDSLIPFKRFPTLKLLMYINADSTSSTFTIPSDTDVILQAGIYDSSNFNKQSFNMENYNIDCVYTSVGETHTTTYACGLIAPSTPMTVTATGTWQDKTTFKLTRSSTDCCTTLLLFKYV